MRREALNTVGVLMAGTAVLVVVFWVVRDWPQLADECGLRLSAQERADIAAYREGYLSIHAAIAAAIGVAIWRLQSVRRGARRPGWPTVASLAIFAAAFASALATPDADGVAYGFFALLASFVLAPAAALLVVAALLLLGSDRRDRLGALLALVAAWLALAAVVPAHAYVVWSAGDRWCLEGL